MHNAILFYPFLSVRLSVTLWYCIWRKIHN